MSALTFERTYRLGLAAISSVVIARYLGPSGLGLLNFGLSAFALAAPLVTLGLPPILTRDISTGADWKRLIATSLAAQLPIGLALSALASGAIILANHGDPEATQIALALSPLPPLMVERTFRAYLEAKHQFSTIVAAGLVASTSGFMVRVGAAAFQADTWVIALGSTVEAAIVFVLLTRALPRPRHHLHGLRRHASASLGRSLATEGWPLLVAAVAVTIYMRVDIFMLGMLADEEETGIYSAAARMSEVWYYIPTAGVAVLRPRLSALFRDGLLAEYSGLLQRAMSLAVACSYIAVAAAMVLGGPVIELLYGSEFARSASVLRIHVLAAPFVFLGVVANPWFVDRQYSKPVLTRSVAGAAANVVLNALLIPRYGADGAAIATLVSYALSGFVLNGLSSQTRPVFFMQTRALILRGVRTESRAR